VFLATENKGDGGFLTTLCQFRYATANVYKQFYCGLISTAEVMASSLRVKIMNSQVKISTNPFP